MQICQKCNQTKTKTFLQNKIEKEAAKSKRSFFNLFNKTSGKMLPTHHNKQIVENIETFNTFFANFVIEIAKTFDTKQRLKSKLTQIPCCFLITSAEIIDTASASMKV